MDAADDPTDLLELWFARAGASPLSISIHCSDNVERLTAVLARLAPYFLRCTQIDLRIPGMEVPQINALSGPFLLLRELTVHLTKPARPRGTSPTFAAFFNAQILRRLRISTSVGSYVALKINAMPVTLTHLEIDASFTAEQCLRLLEKLPALLHLSVPGLGPISSPSPPMPRVLALQSLHLGPYCELLSHLTIPSLRRLKAMICDRTGLLAAFSASYALSFADIRHLDVNFYRREARQAFSLCLDIAPNVSHCGFAHYTTSPDVSATQSSTTQLLSRPFTRFIFSRSGG
ncbi:hypothetical protein C8J57DRAFT_1472259 [Mycena rebaudengoi]|nr:hypothetical protein C8J57DRAFT_1472259 [Mycena rebaudengoi]